MSDPWQPAATGGLGSLDPTSKRRAGLFLWRIAVLAGFVMSPYFAHKQPLQESLRLLALTFAFGGLLSVLFATVRREPFAKGSINGWDEALVFVALSRLAHAAAQIQP